jgi:hypothetical protein
MKWLYLQISEEAHSTFANTIYDRDCEYMNENVIKLLSYIVWIWLWLWDTYFEFKECSSEKWKCFHGDRTSITTVQTLSLIKVQFIWLCISCLVILILWAYGSFNWFFFCIECVSKNILESQLFPLPTNVQSRLCETQPTSTCEHDSQELACNPKISCFT